MIQSAPYRFALSLLLSALAVFASFQSYGLAAIGVAWLAAFLYFPPTARGPSWRLWAFVLALGVLGLEVHRQLGLQLPLLIPALLLAGLGPTYRMILFDRLSPRATFYLEVLSAVSALVLLVTQQVLEPHGWQGWVFPLPGIMAIFFTLFVARTYWNEARVAGAGYKVQLGKPSPDFELPNEGGQIVKLSDYKGKSHVLLFFYRGDWCPYCHIMLRTYNRHAQAFKDKQVTLLAVGPDDPGITRSLVDMMGLGYQVLSDPQLTTVRLFGISANGGNEKNELDGDVSPLPASFLVDKQGILRFTSHPAKVGEFLAPDLIFPVLAAI